MSRPVKFAIFALFIAAMIFSGAVIICGVGIILFHICGVWGFISWAAVVAVISGFVGAAMGKLSAKRGEK